jgi:hypothetical protein
MTQSWVVSERPLRLAAVMPVATPTLVAPSARRELGELNNSRLATPPRRR